MEKKIMARYKVQGFADVEVFSTMQCLGDQPWYVHIYPEDVRLPKRSVFVQADCAFNAAVDAVHEYKEAHHLNLSNCWSV